MYGTQAECMYMVQRFWFENDVKMYGTQAKSEKKRLGKQFENDVKMYGTQACSLRPADFLGLRMM